MKKMMSSLCLALTLSIASCSSTPKSSITEVVIYKIKRGKVPEYLKARELIKKEIKGFNGYLGINTTQSISDNHTFRDVCYWTTKQDALNAFKEFEKLPSAKKFMNLMDGKPKFADHFKSIK